MHDAPDTMDTMTVSLVYLLLRQVLQMLTQLARNSRAKHVEILVSHHQVAELRRRVHRPDLQPANRVVLTAQPQTLAPCGRPPHGRGSSRVCGEVRAYCWLAS
jgi:hypothetical protein